jgi:[ribosomal protein S5]-alanine N-acetyltransferase
MTTLLSLQTARLTLVTPSTATAAAAHAYFLRNQRYLAPWSPPAPPNIDTLAFWQDYALKARDALTQGHLVRFWMFRNDEPSTMIGSFGFSQIFRGPFCSATLGYQIDEAAQGQGLMFEALDAGIEYMFGEQALHRIAANYLPHNVRSARLLTRLGFRIEGYAENYLFIDGAWRDHVLTALINPRLTAPD